MVETIDLDLLVEELGIEHRAKAALRALMEAGATATPAVRRGLRHADPRVRARCCDVLDHYLDEEAIPDLLSNLEHEDPWVRGRALHALSCERCKEGTCRPAEDEVIAAAARRLLADDPDRYVRTAAAHALGPSVHRKRAALDAVIEAHEQDPDPMVRKVAGWYCPGGPIFNRLQPRETRRVRTA